MSIVTAELVGKLRAATGISLMKCKQALEEAGGDLEKARDVLRKQGEKDAAKKADRSTSEGVVIARTSADGKKGALVQIFCETDFVARGEDFQSLANELVEIALTKGADVAKQEGEKLIQGAIQKIGENVRLGDIAVDESKDSFMATYVHGNQKIGVLVTLKTGSAEVGRDIAMQIAALNPGYLLPEEVPTAELEKEREVQAEILKKEGKPEEMISKIIEGKLRKFREDQSLIKQAFVKDASKTVEQFLKESNTEIARFFRFSI